MMDKKNIEILLNKYWDAETIVEEENTLNVYFNSDHVDPALEYAKVYFVIPQYETKTATDNFSVNIIKRLIDKYFEADTSVEEEGILKDYFSQSDIHSSLVSYKELFNLYNRQKSVTFGKDLSLSKTIDISTQKSSKVINMNWIRAAAAILILSVGGIWLINRSTDNITHTTTAAKTNTNYIEVDDPELALKYTMEALALVSKKYKKGEEQLLESMKTMNDANILQ
jgi:hypothetical protein